MVKIKFFSYFNFKLLLLINIDKSEYVHQKICYNNFLKDSQNYRVFSSYEDDSLCDNPNILHKYAISVGFGTAVDTQGRGYVVRLISTNQKRQR